MQTAIGVVNGNVEVCEVRVTRNIEENIVGLYISMWPDIEQR